MLGKCQQRHCWTVGENLCQLINASSRAGGLDKAPPLGGGGAKEMCVCVMGTAE